MNIEEIKRIDMVDFLQRYYGMKFQNRGNEWVSPSPFSFEKNPSFFVRKHSDGHWLFKDFSGGGGGSLIDFVLLKENFARPSEASNHIRGLCCNGRMPISLSGNFIAGKEEKKSKYDIQAIYSKLTGNDMKPCREYLLRRGIDQRIIEDLTDRKILLHNCYKGVSYCTFAVFTKEGELKCLDNHEIEGNDKFVLGNKTFFTLDWEFLPLSNRIFVCEAIIDYLSLKTLYQGDMAGVALLGNQINFPKSLIQNAREIVSAMDLDGGGAEGLLEMEEFLEKDQKIITVDFGESKDANDYLLDKPGKKQKLTAQDKLQIYKEFSHADNKSDLALKWGVNRTYLYEIAKECEEFIIDGFSERRQGRRAAGSPLNLEDAFKKVAALEEEKRREATEKERFYARSEFLKVRLKWAEEELSEIRGEDVKRKKQIKKKRKRSS